MKKLKLFQLLLAIVCKHNLGKVLYDIYQEGDLPICINYFSSYWNEENNLGSSSPSEKIYQVLHVD